MDQIYASKLCKRVNGQIISPPTTLEETYGMMGISGQRRTYLWTTGRVKQKAEWTEDSYPAKGIYEYYDEVTGEDIEPLRENKYPYYLFYVEEASYSYIPELCITCGFLHCENQKCSRSVDYGALCKVKVHIWFKLYGLCKESTVDRRYRLVEPETNGLRNSYVGDSGWTMVYEYEHEAWKISHKLYPERNLTMKVNNRLPVGRFRWEIANSTCNEGITEIRTLQVSTCKDDQFTCDDGSCVPLAGRCDSVGQCDDVSDEKQCNLVSMDEKKYLKDRPPSPKLNNKFPVNASIDIRSVLNINEVGMILKLLFVLDLTWFDDRLQFYNLKPDDNMNTLTSEDQKAVWTPTVLFDNTEKQLTSRNDEKSFAKVTRLGNSTRSGNTYNEDIDIFEGNDNPIRLSRAYDIDFICEYDMRWYPFDSQTCHMIIMMEGNTGKFVNLISDSIEYTGPKELTQYFVKNTNMGIKDIGSRMGVLVVSITLGRRLLGTILTIFLPTVLLNLIGHATNFFKAFFFEAVVTVNLTAMLVLTTMFINVSNNLPKTSYIKMMDIWLIFNLLLPFIEIMLHTYMDMLRNEEDREINHHGRPVQVGGDDDKSSEDSNTVTPLTPVSEVENPNGIGGSIKLISRNEKTQVKALHDHYMNLEKRRKAHSERRLALCKKFSIYYNPMLALTFIAIYWGMGLRHAEFF